MKVLRLAAALFFISMNTFAQTKQENWQKVLLMNQQFENYKNDFIQFGKSTHSARSKNAEDLSDMELVTVADQTVSHLEYIETLVSIYLKVSSKQDRLVIWPLITDQLATTSKRLDQQIEIINAEISVLRSHGVVVEAMHMRDDLRLLKDHLDGAQKEIDAAEAKIP